MRTKIFIAVFLTAFVLFGCKKEEKKDSKAAEGPVFAVNTILAVQGPIQDYLSFSGDIVAGSTIDVLPEAAGKVTEIYVSVGQRVSRGARIAAVDPSRPGMTFRQNIATTPISGTVVMIPAQVGMTVSQAVPLARIAGGGGLEIKLNIAERFISRMALNQPCEITLDAWPGETFKGSVSEVAPTVDLASRTMEVRVNVSDTSSKLKPGMFAKVRVITERKNNIVKIPASAVLNRFGEQYVYIVEKAEETEEEAKEEEPKKEKKSLLNKKPKDESGDVKEETEEVKDKFIVKKRIITPGILIDGVIEIAKGLEPNEEVVVRGQTLLDDGSRVNVIERVAPIKD